MNAIVAMDPAAILHPAYGVGTAAYPPVVDPFG